MTNISTSMPSQLQSSKLAYWVGWGLTGLFTLFMAFDVTIKLIRMQVVDDAMTQLGYPAGLGFLIGAIEAVALVLYLAPRTSVLGAVLFTGVFGGAMASHLRVESPLFSHVLFGVYLGLIAWGGLWLRDARLRALFPLRRVP